MTRNIVFSSIFLVLATMFTACAPPACQDVDCGDHGTCFEGACECAPGWQGIKCQTKSIDMLAGKYQAQETCDSIPGPEYLEEIAPGADETHAIIKNFGNSGADLPVEIISGGKLAFTNVDWNISGKTYKLSGSSERDFGSLVIDYSAKLNDTVRISCVHVMTKF